MTEIDQKALEAAISGDYSAHAIITGLCVVTEATIQMTNGPIKAIYQLQLRALREAETALAATTSNAAETAEPVADGWENLTCDDQFALATKIAGNVGYDLIPERSLQDAEDAAEPALYVPTNRLERLRAVGDQHNVPLKLRLTSAEYAHLWTPLYAAPQPLSTSSGEDRAAIVEEAEFLLDRLDDLERAWDEDAYRDFCGHVLPPAARLRAAIRKLSEKPK